jgi:anti-sigma regulatory factor (Ser/Thr protein kinase)
MLMAAAQAFAERELTLGEYTSASRAAIESRIREVLKKDDSPGEVAGVVTFAGDENFFIQAATDALKIMVGDECDGKVPRPGEVISVSGTPSLDGGRVVFEAKSWKKVGSGEIPQPRSATAEDLVFAGDVGKGVNWLRTEITGRALGLTARGFAMDVDGVPVSVFAADLPPFMRNCDKTRPMVKVSGVVELMLDQSSLFSGDRYVIGVKLNVSEIDTIELQRDLVYLVNCRDRRVAAIGAALIVALAAGLVVFALVIFRQRRRHFRTRTVMEERKRMADDLHDTIEQHLAGAGMLIRLGRSKEAQDVLAHAKREMRDIVWGLMNDDMLRLSPADMLRQMAKNETKKGICRVDVRLDGLPESMDAQSMRDLSLIVREAIGNAVKHGGAKKIAIASDPDGAGWMLRIANDGEPFDPAAVPGPAEGHFGVEGMRQRARRLGAEVAYEQKGQWTVLVLKGKKK